MSIMSKYNDLKYTKAESIIYFINVVKKVLHPVQNILSMQFGTQQKLDVDGLDPTCPIVITLSI